MCNEYDLRYRWYQIYIEKQKNTRNYTIQGERILNYTDIGTANSVGPGTHGLVQGCGVLDLPLPEGRQTTGTQDPPSNNLSTYLIRNSNFMK